MSIAFDSLVGTSYIEEGVGAPFTNHPQEFTAQELVRLFRHVKKWEASISGNFDFENFGTNYTSSFSATWELNPGFHYAFPISEPKMACPFVSSHQASGGIAGTWVTSPEDPEEEPQSGDVSVEAFISIGESSNLPGSELPAYKYDQINGVYWPCLRAFIRVNYLFPLFLSTSLVINFEPGGDEPLVNLQIDEFEIPGLWEMEGTLSLAVASIKPKEFWGYDPGDGGGPIWDSSTGNIIRSEF